MSVCVEPGLGLNGAALSAKGRVNTFSLVEFAIPEKLT
jgi:hypothetical protein